MAKNKLAARRRTHPWHDFLHLTLEARRLVKNTVYTDAQGNRMCLICQTMYPQCCSMDREVMMHVEDHHFLFETADSGYFDIRGYKHPVSERWMDELYIHGRRRPYTVTTSMLDELTRPQLIPSEGGKTHIRQGEIYHEIMQHWCNRKD